MKNARAMTSISAGYSAICSQGKESTGLTYRGYSVHDLAKYACFEEVAYLLFYGNLPTQSQLSDFQQRLISLRSIPSELQTALELMPKKAHPIAVLHTACSVLGTLEPERSSDDHYYSAERLLAIFPSIINYWHHFHTHGQRISTMSDEKSSAGHFLHLLQGIKPQEMQRRVMDISLILYAEEAFNPSTLCARVAAAAMADFHSAVCSALGALLSPLQPSANPYALELIQSFQTAEEAEAVIRYKLVNNESVSGFNRCGYAALDPRTDIIKNCAHKLSETVNDKILYTVAERIERVMWEIKNLFPNLDFYTALAYHFCQVPPPMFTPLFAVARLSGWSAHIIEQRAENNSLCPTAEYIGPKLRNFLKINER